MTNRSKRFFIYLLESVEKSAIDGWFCAIWCVFVWGKVKNRCIAFAPLTICSPFNYVLCGDSTQSRKPRELMRCVSQQIHWCLSVVCDYTQYVGVLYDRRRSIIWKEMWIRIRCNHGIFQIRYVFRPKSNYIIGIDICSPVLQIINPNVNLTKYQIPITIYQNSNWS